MNFDISLMRLKSLLKKLLAEPKLAEKYKAIFHEQAKLYMIEKVPTDSTPELIHYISHDAVVCEDHTTTKVRIVFDASAKQGKQSPTLNYCLYRGPLLLTDLAGMLIRLRQQVCCHFRHRGFYRLDYRNKPDMSCDFSGWSNLIDSLLKRTSNTTGLREFPSASAQVRFC